MIRLWKTLRKIRLFGLCDWIGISLIFGALFVFLGYQQFHSMKWEEYFSTGKLLKRHTAGARFYIRHIEIDIEGCYRENDGYLQYRKPHDRLPTDYEKYYAPDERNGDEWKGYFHTHHFSMDETDPRFSFAGTYYYDGIRSTTGSESVNEGAWHATIVMPIWFLMIPSGGLFVLSLYMARRLWRINRQTRRREKGLCAGCGYDLRAHQPGAKCPECGKLFV